jgi:hypothetical protein
VISVQSVVKIAFHSLFTTHHSLFQP